MGFIYVLDPALTDRCPLPHVIDLVRDCFQQVRIACPSLAVHYLKGDVVSV